MDSQAFTRQYLSRLTILLGEIDGGQISDFCNVLACARDARATVFFMGNGGSAATASHWVNDMVRWRNRPFRAVSLVDNAAVLTAVANDHSYESVFSSQLESQMSPADVVVAISASGNSTNLVRAVEYANEYGGISVALTGFDGGRLREIAQHVVHVPSATGEYGPVEDAHMILGHLVTAFLWENFANEDIEA